MSELPTDACSDAYYYRVRDQTLGPFDLSDIQQKVKRGVIGMKTPISHDGHHWGTIKDFPHIGRTRAPSRPESDGPLPEGPERIQEQRWYYALAGVPSNDSVPLTGLLPLLASGTIKRGDAVCEEGGSQWQPVESVPEIAALLPAKKPEDSKDSTNAMAIAGFVISLVGCGPVGLILSLVALNSPNQANRGMAIAGAIIGGLGSAGCLCFGILGLLGLLGPMLASALGTMTAY
jgi:hypothetical protein